MMYDACEMDTKKMILSQLMSRISVSRNYEIEIDLNVSIDHFNLNVAKAIEKAC